MKPSGKIRSLRFFILWLITLCVFSGVFASENDGLLSITAEYRGTEAENQRITVDFADEWLLQPDDVYNHKLMQASFAMAAAAFRDKTRDLYHKDFNILSFFAQAGFIEPRTIDYDVIPSINTIGTAIAHKKFGDATLIAVSICGNNYQGEWAGNLTVDDDNRVKGFNDAADRVMDRLKAYIRAHDLQGNLRLWTAGYSRSAAVTNNFAADAVDSGLFRAVYAYTFATPRTTKEPDGERYHNIFNLINPFDMVPMSPFPEWGFNRYGIDLFFPSIETDSDWYRLQADAIRLYETVSGDEILVNPQMNKNLHTVFDYLVFFVSSANTYKATYQSPIVDFIETRDLQNLFHDLFEKISFSAIRERFIRRNEIARYQMHEFYNFLDYLTQLIYSGIIAEKNLSAGDFLWDPGASALENIAFNHYVKIYRSWLFSNDDPDQLLAREAKYAHVVIRGDVDVDVFDEEGNFIFQIKSGRNYISFDEEDIRMPDYAGTNSDTYLYCERQKDQTLIVLPMDQIFTVGIYSNKQQTIQVSYVEFSAEKLQADVRYIYLDEYDAGEYYLEVFDPAKEGKYTTEDLLKMGVMVVEPWSGNIVYSPTAVMKLENDGIPHPSPKFLLLFIAVILILMIFLIIRILIGIFRLFRKLLKKRSCEIASFTD